VSALTVRSLFEPVITSAVDALWRQWAAVGGSASAGAPAHCIIDPEAMVLASSALTPREARLRQVMADWLRAHADVLSVQRLSNLAGTAPTLPHHDLASIASVAILSANGHRWKKLASNNATEAASRLTLSSPGALRLTSPATAMLRLRLGMGVGVKADATAYLLGTSGWRSVQEVTRATAYTVAAVRRGLDELAQARFIESEEPMEWQARRARHFRADPKAWRNLLDAGASPPSWGYFRERYDFVVHVSQWMHEGNAEQRWDEVQLGDWGRRWMEQHPIAFRFGADDRAAYRGKLSDWAAHFTTSLDRLQVWFEEKA
jgi:hypothetical protein